MKTVISILTICLVIIFTIPSTAQSVTIGTITIDGLERKYRLAIPSNHNINSPTPLVFNMHGFGSTAAEQEFYADMNRIAEREGFIICYPEGIANAWNVGWTFGSQADDVKFVDQLSDFLIQEYNIDNQKIYACGMSNGGFMSYRLACELNNKIAAIASVTGSMAPDYVDSCNPGREVPVLQFHGTADNTVLYNGLEDVNIPIDSLIGIWVSNNSCSTIADTVAIDDINTADNSTVSRIHYADCAGDSEVLFYKIEGGGHTWPGAFLNIGITNQDIKASELIWEFFKDKTLNSNTSPVFELEERRDFTIFPNPSSHSISIKESDHLGSRFLIYNIQGKLISQGINDLNQIDISSLSKGYYTIMLRNNQGVSLGKFSKI